GTAGSGRNGNGNRNGNRHAKTSAPQGLMDSPNLPRVSVTLGDGQSAPQDVQYKRELLAALTALKKGDFTARLPVDWPGLDGKIADTFNEVIELNHRMAVELERLSRVVGKEGKISQRASAGDVSGAWATTVASGNALVSDLVHPISETARVI